jgi:hypothetical protein
VAGLVKYGQPGALSPLVQGQRIYIFNSLQDKEIFFARIPCYTSSRLTHFTVSLPALTLITFGAMLGFLIRFPLLGNFTVASTLYPDLYGSTDLNFRLAAGIAG